MGTMVLLLGLALGSAAQDIPGCGDPPSRASSAYWDYIDACGCAKLEPPSRASQDYDRYMKACSQWRRENPQVNVIVPTPSASPSATTSPTPSPGPSPKPTPAPSPSPTASPKPPKAAPGK